MDKGEPRSGREPGGCVLGAETRQCSGREWSALMLLRENVKMHGELTNALGNMKVVSGLHKSCVSDVTEA